MAVPTFSKLKAAYPNVMHPDGNFPSCAVRLSICLAKFNLYDSTSFRRYGGAVSNKGWAKAAEKLYRWLCVKSTLGACRTIPVKIVSETASDKVHVLDTDKAVWHAASGLPKRNGIIYLRDCWVRDTDKAARRTGDHIDLYHYDSVSRSAFLVTSVLWPKKCNNAILLYPRDQKIRFWACP
jgi:hypothetical protein